MGTPIGSCFPLGLISEAATVVSWQMAMAEAEGQPIEFVGVIKQISCNCTARSTPLALVRD